MADLALCGRLHKVLKPPPEAAAAAAASVQPLHATTCHSPRSECNTVLCFRYATVQLPTRVLLCIVSASSSQSSEWWISKYTATSSLWNGSMHEWALPLSCHSQAFPLLFIQSLSTKCYSLRGHCPSMAVDRLTPASPTKTSVIYTSALVNSVWETFREKTTEKFYCLFHSNTFQLNTTRFSVSVTLLRFPVFRHSNGTV